MSIHELLLAKCELCCCEDPQVRAILKQLRRKLGFLQAAAVGADDLLAGQPDTEGFLQLLRVAGLRSEGKETTPANCKHPRLFKFL